MRPSVTRDHRGPEYEGRRRILHVVKTSDGAGWAVSQVAELINAGLEVHVVLPSRVGSMIEKWRETQAILHYASLDFPTKEPWVFKQRLANARRLVDEIGPDLIHTHFYGPTITLRIALGRDHPTPRVFQVPGPLHLEHALPRLFERTCAGSLDFWIASSRYIQDLYAHGGVPKDRCFLSYYGFETEAYVPLRTGRLRRQLGVSDSALLVGNASYMYPPRRYLGQRIGLKCHEHLIEAIALVMQKRSDVVGAFIGGTWGTNTSYEPGLRRRASALGHGKITMLGHLPQPEVRSLWPDFDCAIHVPLSENCGGVVEPLLCGVPTIAGRVGGLMEVVKDGITGLTVPPQDPPALAEGILMVLDQLGHFRDLALHGRALVTEMFDIKRTAAEVRSVYEHILSCTKVMSSRVPSAVEST